VNARAWWCGFVRAISQRVVHWKPSPKGRQVVVVCGDEGRRAMQPYDSSRRSSTIAETVEALVRQRSGSS
jgi:hypothetical protein